MACAAVDMARTTFDTDGPTRTVSPQTFVRAHRSRVSHPLSGFVCMTLLADLDAARGADLGMLDDAALVSLGSQVSKGRRMLAGLAARVAGEAGQQPQHIGQSARLPAPGS